MERRPLFSALVTESQSQRTIKSLAEASRTGSRKAPRWRAAKRPASRPGPTCCGRGGCGTTAGAATRPGPDTLLGAVPRRFPGPHIPCRRCLILSDLLYREIKRSACQVHKAPKHTTAALHFPGDVLLD